MKPISTTHSTPISIARVKAKIKQVEAARRLGISVAYLLKVEAGDANPSRELQVKASILTGFDVIGGTTSPAHKDKIISDYLEEVRSRIQPLP